MNIPEDSARSLLREKRVSRRMHQAINSCPTEAGRGAGWSVLCAVPTGGAAFVSASSSSTATPTL